MGLLDKRLTYSPFEYSEPYEYWVKQQSSHWLPTEVQLGSDVTDWKTNLTDVERSVIGRTLKGFTQAEVLIQDYWATKVTRWFKKSEIQTMASCFASFESIHAIAYALLQETLGLNDFDAFLTEPAAKARIDRLLAARGKSREEIAKSLAVFSAFSEGVSLFSSFAILLSFSRKNLLKGVGQIISWSIRDESLHSEAGCWLFRQLIKEYPEILTEEVKEEIYEGARLTVKLEDDFIDQAFQLGDIETISADDLKAYIRFRTNTKLKDLGFKSLYKNIDKEKLENLAWFNVLSSGVEMQDFFAGRVTTYAKSTADFSEIWAKHDAGRS